MRRFRSILVSVPLLALAALCLQMGAGALGGHLCRGVALAAASACERVCCAADCVDDQAVLRHGVRPEHGPLDSPDSECCIRASLVLMAPTLSAEVRPASQAPHWLLAPAPLAPVAGASGLLSRSRAAPPRPPEPLALVTFAILNI